MATDAAGAIVGGALVADWDDSDVCGTWWPGWPHVGPVGSASDPTYAFTNAAGQVLFNYIANGATGKGATDTLFAAGQDPPQAAPPAMTSYSC